MKEACISVITVTYNSEKTLQETINSIRDQKYPKLEYIVVDGGSNDSTIEIIKRNSDIITYWVSEPDKGLYDAMNKGIFIAKGEIIGILNSDDIYANSKILKTINSKYQNHSSDLIYGNLGLYDQKLKRKIRNWKSSYFIKNNFRKGWHPPHPSLFVSKNCYEKVGCYDLNYRICADFEFMLRAFEVFNCTFTYIDVEIVKMRHGGKSTGSLKNIIDGNLQIYSAFKKNNYKVSPFYFVLRVIPKIREALNQYYYNFNLTQKQKDN